MKKGMRLKRYWKMDRDSKMSHLGPCPGGWFFAHETCNDLPGDGSWTSVHDLAWMLDHGRVWVANAEREIQEWTEIRSVGDLPTFKWGGHDDYGACTTTFGVYPYMPEFYWLPSSDESRKALRKDAQRQYVAEYLEFREWDKKRQKFHEISSWRRLYY